MYISTTTSCADVHYLVLFYVYKHFVMLPLKKKKDGLLSRTQTSVQGQLQTPQTASVILMHVVVMEEVPVVRRATL